MRSGERVIVEDVCRSEVFAGQPSETVLLDAGVRAVISTPLANGDGRLLGVISTHYGKPYRPTERRLRLMDLLARQAADFLERKQAQDIQDALNREVQHRSNNLLAIVQATAHLSLSGERSLAEAKEMFEARLQSLARANRQLLQSNWNGLDLRGIVHAELASFMDRITVEGMSVLLAPQRAQSFTLALHELTTNAVKYGALSNESGKVEVSWSVANGRSKNVLSFRWQERGGPAVIAPARQGFGTKLLQTTFPLIRLEYPTQGFSCEVDVPLDVARNRSEPLQLAQIKP